MLKEQFPHIPNIKTTPERIIEKEGIDETVEKKPLNKEQIKEAVEELAELSAFRAEAAKHLKEVWGLTVEEREKLKKGGETVIASYFESANIDPEIAEFSENRLKEYDERIKELASRPEVLEEYKKHFEKEKSALVKAIEYEHRQKDLSALVNLEQKLKLSFKEIGKAMGPLEKKKMTEIEEQRNKLQTELEQFNLDEKIIDILRRREIRRIQYDLKKYKFAETESRSQLIKDILPEILRGEPVLFQGETGSGKSQLAKYISKRYLERKPVLIPIHEQIKESQILGKTELKEGATQFIYSQFVLAIKEGRPVIFDEVNRMPPEFASIFHDIYQLKVGDIFTHSITGEKMPIKKGFVIFATANLKSERYKYVHGISPEVYRRFVSGAGVKEIHYLDLGKKDKEGRPIAPETLKILSAVLADRRGNIDWDEKEASQKLDELLRFVAACRQIQEDFTLSIKEEAEETLSRGDRLAFKELVITLQDQIEIMKSWKADGFKEPLDKIILREFFQKAEISGRPAKDRENMIRVFMTNKFFQDIETEEFKIHGLSTKAIRAWQGKE